MQLKVKNIKFRYLNSKDYIFNGLNFNIDAFDFPVRIEGDNGIGKTTLIKLICGIEKINSGTIELIPNGVDIGYTPQQPIAIPWLSVKKNIDLVSTNKNKLYLEILEDFPEYPHACSGGQQQILSLIMSLNTFHFNNRESNRLLILDEPLKSLDRKNIVIVQEIVKDFIKTYEANLIYISHQQDIVKPNSILRLTKPKEHEVEAKIIGNT